MIRRSLPCFVAVIGSMDRFGRFLQRAVSRTRTSGSATELP